MDYVLEVQYGFYMAEQLEEGAKLERFINETILMSEGTNSFANVQILNEGFVDKIKLTIKKIAQSIGTIWAKFLEAMNNLLRSNKGYLDKYKDIILKKKPIDATYTMYNYPEGLKMLVKASVPAFNYDALKDKLADEDSFINGTNLAQYKISGSQASFLDQAKSKFRSGESGTGKEVEMKASQLNMTDLFNFCYHYDTVKNGLEKDIKEIQNAAIHAIDIIDKMARENKVQNTADTTQGNTSDGNNQGNSTQESALRIFDKPKYYSAVYETYITELERTLPNQDSNGNNNANTGNSSTNNNTTNATGQVHQANTNVNGKEDRNANDAAVSNDATDGNKTAEEIRNKVSLYMKVCGGFLGAKQTVYEEIYKAYMSIIKMHVQDHVGKTKDAQTNKPTDSSTSYGDNKDNGGDENNNTEQSSTNDINKGTVADWFSGKLDQAKEKLKKK